jgi:preprotein translocase subunit SecB
MAEQNNANMPAFRLEKLYLKDISFESPNTPDVFFLQDQEPKVGMNLKMTNKKIDEKHWEVCLEISATITDTKSDKTLMIVEVEHAAGFLLDNIPEEHIEQVLHVDCPTILFPYTRQIVSQVSVDGGFMPFLMEPINFPALFQAKKQKVQEKKEGKSKKEN